MTWKVELIPTSEGNRITVKENEKIIVGRGSSLGCNDKKISRQHAELLLKKDKTLWIKPTHTNPVFYRPSNGKTIQLTKDIEQELKDNDQIDVNNNKDELSSKHTDHHTNGASTSSSAVKDQNESETINSDEKSRKLPTWMSTSTTTTTTSTSPSNTTFSDRPSVKRQLSSEENNNSTANKPSTTSDTSATVSSKSSKPKTFDSDSGDDFDSVSPKKLKSSDKRRPACPYGSSCYRKNATHRTEQSHPGDSDYEDEKQMKDNDSKDDNDADKPQCPYGKSCYRQNPQHKRDYKH